jgi:hypothetical protein
MNNLKDRAIGAIQRNRLSNLLKESVSQGNGCFYLSLLMSWEKLNPMKLLPRDIEGRLLYLDKGLGVSPSEVVDAVLQQESVLGLIVSKITITNKVTSTPDQARIKFNFSRNIPVDKMSTNIITLGSGSDGIIYWQKQDGVAHFTATSASSRFSGEEVEYVNVGGQEGADESIRYGFVPAIVFQISKNQ